MLEEGIEHKNREDFAAAAATLQRLVRRFPGSPIGNWMLGAILLSELKRPRRAIPYFKQAIKADPRSERCSLGLFHALWAIDDIDAALEEMKRYQLLTNWSCADYRGILAEMKEKWLDDKSRPAKKSKMKSSP